MVVITKTPNKTRILLSKNIIYFRQLPENHYSQDDLAQIMNCSRTFLSEIERATRSCSTDYIDRLAKVFNITPDELFKDRNFNLKKRVDSTK